jgi:AAA+ ATPase superfamily predicted ATPase
MRIWPSLNMIIGRVSEQIILEQALKSSDSELIAVYGRRRVGKTYLIRQYFSRQMLLDFSGVHNENLKTQLTNFRNTLMVSVKQAVPSAIPNNWTEAFLQLQQVIEPQIKKNKGVIFLDEFPWLNSQRSGFLKAFEFFWNSWASKQRNLIVVICGSAASWMIQKVVNNKGGLHNRITKKIRLLPFTLKETLMYLRHNKINLDEYQVLQLYMAMGGIPQYLKEIQPGQSATQNIDLICFTKDGPLQGEFTNLYRSLFDQADRHIAIVRALADRPTGLNRKEISTVVGIATGGRLTEVLEELTESGFISYYLPFGNNVKDSIYKLSDEYSRFYLKFIEHTRSSGAGTWSRLSRSQSWTSWSGGAFESICLKHVVEIKKSLGISGIQADESIWRFVPGKGKPGAQIDLLIDRADHCISICEVKFSTNEFTIDKKYSDELQNKLSVFKAATKTKKTLLMVMVTTFGVKDNTYRNSLVQNEVTIENLFN